MALSPADRRRLGLDIDDTPAQEFAVRDDEFGMPAHPIQPPPPITANPRLTLVEGEKATTPKIRQMVNELLAGNIQEADVALKTLLRANPKLGLELYVELAQFSLPKLKAVAVQVNDSSDNPRGMSFADLQKVLQSD